MNRLNRHTSIQDQKYGFAYRALRLAYLCSFFMFSACAITNDTDNANNYNPLDEFEDLTPSTMMDAPAPNTVRAGRYDASKIAKGKYLVEVLGCGTCHTNGALVGTPDFDRRLAGSSIGIAYSNPLRVDNPGVVFPPNLTPDPKTGIGLWSDKDVIRAIHHGVDRDGNALMPVMPWPAYAKISQQDAEALVAYLRSLSPVKHKIPDNTEPGTKTSSPYVHFGVYRSRR